MDALEALLAVPSPPALGDAARIAGCPAEGVRALERAARIVVLEPDLAYAMSTYRDLAARAIAHGRARAPDAGRLPRRDRDEPQVRDGHPRGPRSASHPAADAGWPRSRPEGSAPDTGGPVTERIGGDRARRWPIVAVRARQARRDHRRAAAARPRHRCRPGRRDRHRRRRGARREPLRAAGRAGRPGSGRVRGPARRSRSRARGFGSGRRSGDRRRGRHAEPRASRAATACSTSSRRAPMPRSSLTTATRCHCRWPCVDASAEPAVRKLLGGGERRLRALTGALEAAVIDESTWRAHDPTAATLHDIDTPEDLPSP